jgi:hypothetical protein
LLLTKNLAFSMCHWLACKNQFPPVEFVLVLVKSQRTGSIALNGVVRK